MSSAYWRKFLVDAGIPVRAAESYSSSFVDNRITEDMVSDLSKVILNDLGITIIGDVIMILKHAIAVTSKVNAEKMVHGKERGSKKQKSDKRSVSDGKKSTESKKSAEVKRGESVKSGKTKLTEPKPSLQQQPKTKSGVTTSIRKKTPVTKPSETKPTVAKPTVMKAKPKKPSVTKPEETKPIVSKQTVAKTAGSKRLPQKTAVPPSEKPPEEHKRVKLSSQPVPKHASLKLKEDRAPRDTAPKHVTSARPPLLKTPHRTVSESEAERTSESDEEFDERSPVMRRVYGGKSEFYNSQPGSPSPSPPYHHTATRQVVSTSHATSQRCVTAHAPDSTTVIRHSPVIVRKVSEEAERPKQGPVITRVVPERSHYVRCVSPDSTTMDLDSAHKQKQTTTIILNTKGKCSVRPVSPPADIQQETRKRKILSRSDGKSALTRVVQRHLDPSPRHSPNRGRRELDSLATKSHNSFRSDVEQRELQNTNKFRSEDDKFDLVSDQRFEHKKKTVKRNSADASTRDLLPGRLWTSAFSPAAVSQPIGSRSRSAPYDANTTPRGGKRAGEGGLASRVLREGRLSQKMVISRTPRRRSEGSHGADRKSDGIFNSLSTSESSVFSRLGKL